MRSSLLRSGLAAVLLTWLATPTFADSPITTGGATSGSSGAPPTAHQAANAPPLTIDSADNDDDQPTQVMGACGPTKANPDGTPDKSAHGEVDAGIGTHGYRHLGGVICKPIGDTGSVTLGIETSQFSGQRGR